MNNHMPVRKVIFSSLLAFSAFSFAEQFERENEWLEQAKQGDSGAMYELAQQYCEVGDYQQSLYWQEKYVNTKNAYNPSFEIGRAHV